MIFQKRRHRLRNLSELDSQIDRMIATQASEWVNVMRNPDSADRARFAEWLKRQSRHATEYLFMEALEQSLSGIDREKRHDVDSLLAEPSAAVIPLRAPDEAPRRFSSKKIKLFALAAAATVVLAVGLVTLWANIGWQDLKTAVGEQRAVVLKDGSTVYLNTQSHVQVKLSAQSRDLRLIKGEALFTVKRDTARPFRVHVGDTVIRALGTQFNVYRKQQATQVAVIEGRVEITSVSPSPSSGSATVFPAPAGPGTHSVSAASPVHAAQLGAGEQAKVDQTGRIQLGVLRNPEAVTAWRERRLVFRDDALEDMVAQFNRYNDAYKIRLEGDFVKRRRYSGVFDVNDPQSLTALLSRESGMRIQTIDGEIVIRERQDGESRRQNAH